MKNIIVFFLVLSFPFLLLENQSSKTNVRYSSVLENSNHPQVCYFFVDIQVLESGCDITDKCIDKPVGTATVDIK
jgi:hypothetical protein